MTAPGCNSTAFSPVPRAADIFVGRQFFRKDGSVTTQQDCDRDSDLLEAIHSNRWGIVLEQLDWQNRRFSIIRPLVDPVVPIAGGPMKGAIIRSAHDPNMAYYRGQYLLVFECSISNGQGFGIDGTSACMGAYDPATRQVALDSLYVVVSGEHTDGKRQFHSVSVPQLLVFGGRLFLYWSEITVQDRRFARIGVRGAELQADGRGFYWVEGVGHLAYSLGPSTTEVWAPYPGNPLADTAVDIKSVWVHSGKIIALSGLGGGGCAAPGPQPGCFRMAIAASSDPLGYHTFNRSPLLDESQLPTNPQNYTRPIRNPSGGYSLLGDFFNPTQNGYSEVRPVPPKWNSQRNHQIVIFPLPDTNLWPTE